MKMNDTPRNDASKGTSYNVKKDQTVEEFLSHIMQGKSRTSIKQLLQKGAISVNNKNQSVTSVITQTPQPSLPSLKCIFKK